MDKLNFAGDFPDASLENWQSAALKALRGGALADLGAELYEQVPAAPLYTRDTGAEAARLSGRVGAAPFIRGARNLAKTQGWAVIQFVDHADVAEAGRQLRDDFANGARAFWVQFLGSIAYGGGSLGARKVEALETVFASVALEEIELYVSGGFDAIAAAAMLAALIERRGAQPARIKGSAGLDPFTHVAATGAIPAERPRILGDAVDAATYLREKNYGLTPFLVSGRAWHQAGGSSREELGFALAAGVTYFRALIDAGWPLEDAAKAIRFSLTADADIFITIAKFRAMRALWSRITEASGLAATPPALIAEMSFRMVTERDPHVNLLRATAAAFGAAIGGAEAILLIPFNTRSGTPDAFARRLARNTQLILSEEAQLGRVADEAGGSWYVESLTHLLAAAAWDEFRAVEAAGGMLAALEQGLIARKLTDVRMRRHANLARNRDKITGVSSYPDICEQPVFAHAEDIASDLTGLDEEGEVAQLPQSSKGKRFAALVEAAQNGATLKGLERACESLTERFDFIPSTAERTRF
jgi:methylmalonyl-CoA mutase